MFAVVFQALLAKGKSQDVEVLSESADWPIKLNSMQAFSNLWPTDSETEGEATATYLGHRDRSHSRHRRRAGADLCDACSERHAGRSSGEEGQGGECILAPGFASPA
jgi:hypothetical protein